MLTPNEVYTMHGVTVREKIIPDGTRWQNDEKAKRAGFASGQFFKAHYLLCKTGRADYVTIHNTNDLTGVADDAEQYTRATYNENMGAARVHFYVDDCGAWQNLRAGTGMCNADPSGSAEVGWHAGDGNVANGGNMTSIAIEIIMGEGTEQDAKSKDNGARIAAWLLHKHGLGIDKLVTHTYWVNKSVGKYFDDVDEQCTNMIYGKKWCPSYIFASNNRDVAKGNWLAFKNLVKSYLNQLTGSSQPTIPTPVSHTLKAGDLVKIIGDTYYSGKAIPSWVKTVNWYVSSVSGDRAVIDKSEDGAYSICSPININSLSLVRSEAQDSTNESEPATSVLQVGDRVSMVQDATVYGKTRKFASWVYKATLYVRQISSDRIVVSTQSTGAITGAVDRKYLTKI